MTTATPPHPSPLPRLPTKADFPPSLTLDIIPPPPGNQPLNVLLLLHGLGDTHAPYSALARALQLPHTVCIALRATSPVPALDALDAPVGFHWGDDLVLDARTGELSVADAGYARALDVVGRVVVDEVLIRTCGFRAREVFFWGFGQGAMVALAAVVVSMRGGEGEEEEEKKGRGKEFGGVVAVGGGLPAGVRGGEGEGKGGKGKARTPVILLGGSRSRQVTKAVVEGVRSEVSEVEYVKWDKSEDGMPANREEMMPIMRFFARRLRSRAGVPDGALEVGEGVGVSLVG